MKAEALNTDPSAEPRDMPPLRKKRHLAGIAVGFLIPLCLLVYAWHHHLASDRMLGFAVISATVASVGIRSWRRWFYPDRLPVRWAEESPTYKRVKVLDWITYGLNLVVMLSIVGFDLGESHRTGVHQLWLAFLIINLVRGLLLQYRADRKPLPPVVPPRDPTKLWPDTIKPIYSKDWGLPGER